jgi:hypothetical protein
MIFDAHKVGTRSDCVADGAPSRPRARFLKGARAPNDPGRPVAATEVRRGPSGDGGCRRAGEPAPPASPPSAGVPAEREHSCRVTERDARRLAAGVRPGPCLRPDREA